MLYVEVQIPTRLSVLILTDIVCAEENLCRLRSSYLLTGSAFWQERDTEGLTQKAEHYQSVYQHNPVPWSIL